MTWRDRWEIYTFADREEQTWRAFPITTERGYGLSGDVDFDLFVEAIDNANGNAQDGRGTN